MVRSPLAWNKVGKPPRERTGSRVLEAPSPLRGLVRKSEYIYIQIIRIERHMPEGLGVPRSRGKEDSAYALWSPAGLVLLIHREATGSWLAAGASCTLALGGHQDL